MRVCVRCRAVEGLCDTVIEIMSALYGFVYLLAIYITGTRARASAETCVFQYPRLRCDYRLSSIANSDDVREIEISKVELTTLDFREVLDLYPNVELVAIGGGNVTSMIPPSRENSVKVLELRRLLLSNISRNFVEHFPKLRVLDLSDNQFQTISDGIIPDNLEELYLENNPWKCSEENLQWALSLNRSIAKDLVNLTCSGFPYPGKPLLSIAHYLKEMKETCLPNCACALERVVQDLITAELKPIVSVNCTALGLTELPQVLPKHTRILHLERNSIQNLSPLKNNRNYRNLWDLYLDYNQVFSIRTIEGSHWLSHFRAFSLKGNKLAKIPAYALDNALLKNPNMPKAVRLYLGDNPWRCDCLFVPVFQELVLRKYANQIKDLREVKCTYVEGDENSLLPIIEVSRSSVCRLPTEYSLQEGLDLLNIVLASLIIFIFGKLLYDYYHFKKSGRLPWIVTKMP